MRLPRPRLTVRRLMVLVALLGALLGAWVEARRLFHLEPDPPPPDPAWDVPE